MREESQLPDELKSLEDQLRSTALPQSRLDRDTVMYQAGWAAAVASLSDASQPTPSCARPTPSSWQWKAATAALASVATVLAVLLVQQSLDANQSSVTDEPVLIAANEVPADLNVPAEGGSSTKNAVNSNGMREALTQPKVIAASHQPTFFQALFGFTSPPENFRLAEKRLEKALNDSVDSRFFDDESAADSDTTPEPKRTYLRASSSILLQEMFPYPK